MRPFLISMFVVAALPVSAVAETSKQPSEKAAPYLERGLRFYNTQKYAEALGELRAGYQIDPHPDFLYAIGQAERLSGNCKDAALAYRAYLRTQPPELEASRAQTQLARCEAPPPPVVPRAPAFGLTGYAMASGGILAIGLGTYFIIAGQQHAREADKYGSLDDRKSHERTARNFRIAGGVSFVGGAVLGTLAVLRYLRADDAETKPSQPTVSASVGSDHVYVGAFLEF